MALLLVLAAGVAGVASHLSTSDFSILDAGLCRDADLAGDSWLTKRCRTRLDGEVLAGREPAAPAQSHHAVFGNFTVWNGERADPVCKEVEGASGLFEEDEEGGLYACRFDATHTSHRAHRRACVTSHRPVPTADRRPRRDRRYHTHNFLGTRTWDQFDCVHDHFDYDQVPSRQHECNLSRTQRERGTRMIETTLPVVDEDYFQLVATLDAVVSHAARGERDVPLVLIELGARYGGLLVNGVNALRQLRGPDAPYHVVGVEPEVRVLILDA